MSREVSFLGCRLLMFHCRGRKRRIGLTGPAIEKPASQLSSDTSSSLGCAQQATVDEPALNSEAAYSANVHGKYSGTLPSTDGS